jgi:hypothetical protein
MLRHPCTIGALQAPDGDRRTHDVCGHVACHALRLRGDGALWHVGHQPVGIGPETRLDPPLHRVRLERLAPPRQQLLRPLTAQEGRGPRLEMLPACALGLRAPAGGEQMPMGGDCPWRPCVWSPVLEPPGSVLPLTVL